MFAIKQYACKPVSRHSQLLTRHENSRGKKPVSTKKQKPKTRENPCAKKQEGKLQ